MPIYIIFFSEIIIIFIREKEKGGRYINISHNLGNKAAKTIIQYSYYGFYVITCKISGIDG